MLAMNSMDLAELTATQLEALSPQFAAKGVQMHTELATARLRGDRAKLGQVIAACSPARSSSCPGTAASTLRSAPSTGSLQLGVSDDGPGIPVDERERVFNRFWRGSASAQVAGRGIGLAVIDEIVRAHGGSVAVGEERNGGARFTVSLPTE